MLRVPFDAPVDIAQDIVLKCRAKAWMQKDLTDPNKDEMINLVGSYCDKGVYTNPSPTTPKSLRANQ